MTAQILQRRRRVDRRRDCDRPDCAGESGLPIAGGQSRGLTLDELICDAWEGMMILGCTRCPACGGAMPYRLTAVAGACRGCGAELS